MIKGKLKGRFLTIDEILKMTNGGHDIFKYYLGSVSRLMNRPWGKKESKLSWGVFPRNGIWFWKDQATEESGTALHFVERYFGLTFSQARDKICWDFGLGGKEINVSPVKVTWEAPDTEDKEYVHIAFSEKPFAKKHHEFWNIVEVNEEHCRKYQCYAVKDAAINRKRVPIGPNEVVFAYYAPDEDAVKLYFPEREKENKFRNNVPFHYLWNYNNLTECEDLIVQKSNKDMIVTTLLAECCTATQAEAIKIFDKDTVQRINKISKRPWIWYGADWQGVKSCKEITDTNKWRYINTEKKYLPDVNDVYGMVKMFNLANPGTGIKELEKFMKLKKLI